MIDYIAIEESNKILAALSEENKKKILNHLDVIPLEAAYNVIDALELAGIIVAYDWMPFHRDQWFFPTTTDYDDLLDYTFEMMEH